MAGAIRSIPTPPLLVEAGDEPLGEEEDVAPALAQRRQEDRDHAQPVHQVRAESARLHLLAQAAVGGRDDPHVDRDGLAAAHRDDRPRLQHPEELRLQLQRQLRHLVEEEGSAVGEEEVAGRVAHRPGEGTAHVAEELALEEVGGERRAVEGPKRAVAPRGEAVERLRHQFLAGARLPADEDRVVAGGHPLDHAEELLHRGIGGDNPVELDRPLLPDGPRVRKEEQVAARPQRHDAHLQQPPLQRPLDNRLGGLAPRQGLGERPVLGIAVEDPGGMVAGSDWKAEEALRLGRGDAHSQPLVDHDGAAAELLQREGRGVGGLPIGSTSGSAHGATSGNRDSSS